ncbi:uncharacterized protein [Dermacentor andersoni]|uniref:uncharacterized protein n=1 Tax=Dermacentor andersoni TaxID=34620 RepID=UPI002417F720|nr:DNA-directed RNA polymerase II subunit RPB1-like [Dermacentor andersoni]
MWLQMLCVLFALAEAQKTRSPISAHGVQYVNDQPESPYRVIYDDDPRYALHGGQSGKPANVRSVRYHSLQAQEQRPYLHSSHIIPATAVSVQSGVKQTLRGAATSKSNQHTPLHQQGAPGVSVGDQSQLVYPQGSLSGYAIPQHVLQQGAPGGASADYLRAGAVYAPTSDIAQYANALQNYAQQLGYPATYAQNQGYPSGSSVGEPTQYVQQPYYVPYYPESAYSGAGAPAQGVADQPGGAVHVPATVPQSVEYSAGSSGAQAGQNGLVYPPRYSPGSPKPATPAYAGADAGTGRKAGTDLSVPSDHYGKGNVPAQVAPTGAGQGVYSYPYGYSIAYVPYRYPVQPTVQFTAPHHAPSPAQPSYAAPVPAYPQYAQPHVPSGPIQPYYAQQNAYANQAPAQPSQEQFAFGGPPRTIYALPGPIASPAAQHHAAAAKHRALPAAPRAEAPAYGRSFVDIGYTAASIYGTPMYSKASPNPFLSKYVNAPNAYFPRGVVSDAAGNVYIHGPQGLPALHPSHVSPSGQGHYAAEGVQYVPPDKSYELGRFVTMHAGKDGVRYIKKKR